MILGIGLTGDPELLEKALKKLKAKSVHVSWISAIDVPESISEEIRASLDIFVDGDGITDAVSLCYDLPYDDLEPLREEEKPDRKVLPYQQLLEAAMYSYRNYQDEKSYGDAIRHIANADPENRWSESEHQLVEHYKRYGNRELVGKSQAMQDLLEKINLAAPHTHARVLIYGESGTGKETVALQIHRVGGTFEG